MSFKDKVCVVTGASSGIGRRTALDLAAEGAKVCVAARRAERLESLLAEMGGEAAGHSYLVTDVSQRSDAAALAAFVGKRYGRCDVLINNAGVNSERRFGGPEDIADVERVMAINLFGVVYCTGEFLPLLRDSAPAHIVNVASVAGRVAVGGAAPYFASKFAVVGFSESIHYDLAPSGITVSLVEPGFIATEGFPQSDLKGDRFMKYTLGSVEGVSKAIRGAIVHNKMQRVTPRWYYLLQVPRLLSPPLWRLLQRKVVAPRQSKRIKNND